LHLPMYFN